MSDVGAVSVKVDAEQSREEWLDLAHKGLQATPAGRYCVFWWTSPVTAAEHPVEATLVEALMGTPVSREVITEQPVTYAGTLFARVWKKGGVAEVITAVMFRVAGDPPYRRREAVPPVDADLIPIDPLFTRDIANNVWNLSSGSAQKEFERRLKMLLTWSDEDLVRVSKSRKSVVKVVTEPQSPLIPRNEKVSYEFSQDALFG